MDLICDWISFPAFKLQCLFFLWHKLQSIYKGHPTSWNMLKYLVIYSYLITELNYKPRELQLLAFIAPYQCQAACFMYTHHLPGLSEEIADQPLLGFFFFWIIGKWRAVFLALQKVYDRVNHGILVSRPRLPTFKDTYLGSFYNWQQLLIVAHLSFIKSVL